MKRKNSNDTIITQTVGTPRGSLKKPSYNDLMSVKSHHKPESEVNYRELISGQAQQNQTRLKPWEGYKIE